MACMGYSRAVMLPATITCDESSAVLAVFLTADVTCRETALEIASALAYLHSLNILHGDLSGGNILLTSSNKDTRKFTCKVLLASASAGSGRAALCAMMLHVSDTRRQCIECGDIPPLIWRRKASRAQTQHICMPAHAGIECWPGCLAISLPCHPSCCPLRPLEDVEGCRHTVMMLAGGRLWAEQGALARGHQHGDLWHSHAHAARAADDRPPQQERGRVCLRRAAVGDVHWQAAMGRHDADAGMLCGMPDAELGFFRPLDAHTVRTWLKTHLDSWHATCNCRP